MNIGQASARSGLNSKTIRYYEAIELVVPARRPQNQYRDYSEADVDQLSFLNSARQLGFSLEDCRGLLGLYRNPESAGAEAKDLAQAQLQKLDQQLERLSSMRARLITMVSHGTEAGKGEHSVQAHGRESTAPRMSFTLMDSES